MRDLHQWRLLRAGERVGKGRVCEKRTEVEVGISVLEAFGKKGAAEKNEFVCTSRLLV